MTKEKLKKENAELKEKISVLLSCKNCPENKGGWICLKEYENKCLTQKIKFIKELEEEKCELLGIIQGKDKAIQELEKENAMLKKHNSDEECLKRLANEWHKQDIDDIYDFIAEDWSVKYFICIMKNKRIVAAEGSCDEDYNGEVSINLFFEHDDEKYYIDDIVWWKEIVLPK